MLPHVPSSSFVLLKDRAGRPAAHLQTLGGASDYLCPSLFPCDYVGLPFQQPAAWHERKITPREKLLVKMAPNNWAHKFCPFLSPIQSLREPPWCGGWSLASTQDQWTGFWLANGSWLPGHTLIRVNCMHNSKSRRRLQHNTRACRPSWGLLGSVILVEPSLGSVLHSLISVLLLIRLKRNTRVGDKISFPSHVSPIYLPWHDAFLKPESRKCCLALLCFPIISPISRLFFSVFLLSAQFLGTSQSWNELPLTFQGCLLDVWGLTLSITWL